MRNDMFDEIVKLAKTPEGIQELTAMITELKEEFYPAIDVAKELIGKDLDAFIDEAIRWSARKSMVAYESYIEEGFSGSAALALTIRLREDIATSFRTAGKR